MLALLALLLGCDDRPETPEGDTVVTGRAIYRDAAGDGQGRAREPARPFYAEFQLEAVLSGHGALDVAAEDCRPDAEIGPFEAHFESTAVADGEGVFGVALAAPEGTFTTMGGTCPLVDVAVEDLEEVRLRGRLMPGDTRCGSFCIAQARARAERECGDEADAHPCRAPREAVYGEFCLAACASAEARWIVAEVSVDPAGLDRQGYVAAAGLGSIVTELAFDRLVDAGDRVIPHLP